MKAQRIEAILPAVTKLLAECCLCGRRCGINRVENARGFCRATGSDFEHARCSSYTLHFGEEPMLVGTGGSGTVFFTHCNLRCVFCQNYQISQLGMGEEVHYTDLARMFFELQAERAENINLVTPTHYIYPILLALRDACSRGLKLPLVYNTNGYDSIELLSLLDGIVEIYLPDMKYMDAAIARKYSFADRYPEVAKQAIKEMYRQVGKVVTSKGVAQRGVIIRHLILPNNLAGSYDFLLWLKDEGMQDVTLGLMSQYSPRHRAHEFEEINSRVSLKEYRRIVRYAVDLGFRNLLTQGVDSRDIYFPDFEKDTPFSE
jgi:putative pyruvate formate lyase activating enzyme